MKKNLKTLIIIASIIAITAIFSGCTKKEVYTIEANQTAFLIPLRGDSTAQASFESEEMLNNAKVATKQVFITKTWTKMGPFHHEFIPDNMLIVVNRTPVTREWSETAGTGTTNQNQAIYAESAESIGFSVGMNCSAQIYSEEDAVKFLYSYNNKTLEEIMDSEIRARVESDFVEKCAEYTLGDILDHKSEIMESVRTDVIDYFNDKGITITVLGMKDGIEYDDPTVQTAINAAFVAERNAEAQEVENKVNIDKAKAEAEAKMIATQSEADRTLVSAEAQAKANKTISNSLTPELLEKIKLDRWNGQLPKVTNSSALVTVDEN